MRKCVTHGANEEGSLGYCELAESPNCSWSLADDPAAVTRACADMWGPVWDRHADERSARNAIMTRVLRAAERRDE